MPLFFSKPLASWLCLFTFSVNMLLQGGVVLCSDGHGGSRLEWGCSQTERGECATSCGPASGACQENEQRPHPCKDKPISVDRSLVQAASPQANLLTLPPPVFIGAVEIFLVNVALMVHSRPLRAVARPPDALGRLRSVILTV